MNFLTGTGRLAAADLRGGQPMMRASLVAVLLLASVGTASAECTWVLWGQPYPPMKEFMFVAVDAFNTREDCLWEKDHRAETIKADLKEGRTPAVVVSVCLPDTVDPRGPKTK
jgi:hypothetical protein